MLTVPLAPPESQEKMVQLVSKDQLALQVFEDHQVHQEKTELPADQVELDSVADPVNQVEKVLQDCQVYRVKTESMVLPVFEAKLVTLVKTVQPENPVGTALVNKENLANEVNKESKVFQVHQVPTVFQVSKALQVLPVKAFQAHEVSLEVLVEPAGLVNEVQKVHQALQVTSFYQTARKLAFQVQPVKLVSQVKLVLMVREVSKVPSDKPVVQVNNATKI